MSNSANKKIIPIIIVAVIAIGILALFSNSSLVQDDQNTAKQINDSQKMDESIQEIEDESQPDPFLSSNLESNYNPSQLRAAIIDQIHDQFPNQEFHSNATRMLEGAGYQVDLYTTKEITVDFYKKLPSLNYDFILIRTHGGEGDPNEEYPTRLFTGEKYATEKYTLEQLSGQVGYGFPFYDEDLEQMEEEKENVYDSAYFTVGSKMVKEGMVGTFPDSVIIIGGCQSARSHDLMESLIHRGAGSVLGWDATIGAMDNDKAMTLLLEDVLVNKVPLRDAVAKINKELVFDFEYVSILKLFNAV